MPRHSGGVEGGGRVHGVRGQVPRRHQPHTRLYGHADDRILDLAAGTCWATELLTRLGVRTVSINGVFDDILPPWTALSWRQVASRSGDAAELQVLPDAGHFDVVGVTTPTWPVVRERILAEVARAKR